MASTYVKLGSIAAIAITLLVVDRYTRIQPMLNFGKASQTVKEGFQMPIITGGRARACGTGMKSCPDGTKCGNGLCINTDPKPLEEKIPLPVLPARI